MRAAEQALERLVDVSGKYLMQMPADELLLAAGIEELRESAVGEDDVERGRERDDGVGNGLDDGVELGAALLERGVELRELRARLLGEGARGFKVGRQGVEAGGELAELFG